MDQQERYCSNLKIRWNYYRGGQRSNSSCLLLWWSKKAIEARRATHGPWNRRKNWWAKTESRNYVQQRGWGKCLRRRWARQNSEEI